MCKLRLGDIVGKPGSDRNNCSACSRLNIKDLREHIILDCPSLKVSRSRIELDHPHNLPGHDDARRLHILREILDNTSTQNLDNLRALYEDWQKSL